MNSPTPGMVFGAILIAAGLAQVIVLAWLGGLWPALIGWCRRDRTAVLDPQTSLVDAAQLLLAPGHRRAQSSTGSSWWVSCAAAT